MRAKARNSPMLRVGKRTAAQQAEDGPLAPTGGRPRARSVPPPHLTAPRRVCALGRCERDAWGRGSRFALSRQTQGSGMRAEGGGGRVPRPTWVRGHSGTRQNGVFRSHD